MDDEITGDTERLAKAARGMYLLLREEFGHTLHESLYNHSGASDDEIAAAQRYAAEQGDS